MSLTRWFQDYVYVPLGGDRHGLVRASAHLVVVLALYGLWHGASWNFVLWGMLFGVVMALEKCGAALLHRLTSECALHGNDVRGWLCCPVSRYYHWLLGPKSLFPIMYTLSIVPLSWVLFRSPTLEYALQFYRSLYTITAFPDHRLIGLFADREASCMILIGIVACTPLGVRVHDWCAQRCAPAGIFALVRDVLYLGLFIICLLEIATQTYQPFLYFQF